MATVTVSAAGARAQAPGRARKAGPRRQRSVAAAVSLQAPPQPSRPAGRRLGLTVAASSQQPAAAAVAASSGPSPLAVPRGPAETVQQAAAAVQRAWEAGVRRQRVELLLPLIGATDLDDWPGGIRQQFKAAQPMVEELLKTLKQLPGLEGPISARILDDGDAVAAWEGAKLAAVLFPTAETLGEVRKIADARSDGLVIIINPQWQKGQVISDFGFLPWQRKANEELAESFKESYVLRQLRMNSDELRLLYSYPSPWAVNLRRPDAPAQTECVAQREAQPTYKELEALLRSVPWSMSSKPLAERLQYEAVFMRNSLESLPASQQLQQGGDSSSGGGGGKEQ